MSKKDIFMADMDSPEVSNSSNDITPQTNNIQNENQQDWEVNNTNQIYNWTQNGSANVKQDNHVDTTGLQMNEINEVMKALSRSDEKQPDYEEFDKEALLSVEQLLGKRMIHVNKMDTEVITKIESITDMLVPGKIIEQLEKSGVIEPNKIINTFGGSLSSLAKYICYNKPSVFLHHHQSTTKQLFLISRSIMNVELTTKSIKPKVWMRTRKLSSYNKHFLKMKGSELSNLQDLFHADDYALDIMQYFRELKTMVSDIAYKVIMDVDVTKRSVTSKAQSEASNTLQNNLQQEIHLRKGEEDGSTIQTTKSIPHNINVINEKFIIDRKYRIHETQRDPIDEFNHSLKEATSTYKSKRNTNRRISGFSKAISPNEPNFHPYMNEHVQGIPQLNTNSYFSINANGPPLYPV